MSNISQIECPTPHSHTEIESVTSCVIILVHYIFMFYHSLKEDEQEKILQPTFKPWFSKENDTKFKFEGR